MVGSCGSFVFTSKEALKNLALKFPSESRALGKGLCEEVNVESRASEDTIAEELGEQILVGFNELLSVASVT